MCFSQNKRETRTCPCAYAHAQTIVLTRHVLTRVHSRYIRTKVHCCLIVYLVLNLSMYTYLNSFPVYCFLNYGVMAITNLTLTRTLRIVCHAKYIVNFLLKTFFAK